MRRRLLLSFAAAVALVALFVASGGHWAVLQGIAWARMFADYSRTDSVIVAAGKTLDGKHPCLLCHKVMKNSAGAKDAPLSIDPAQKIEAFVAPLVAHASPPSAREHFYPAILSLKPGNVLIDPPGPVPKSGLS